MHSVKALALVVPFFALLACGGSVSKLGTGDDGGGDDGPNPSCPQASTVNNGVACNDPGLSCPGAYGQPSCNGPGTPVQCSCGNDGQWQCPLISGGIECPPPPSQCPDPAFVNQGATCSTDPSLSCTSSTPIYGCDGTPQGTLTCNCFGGTWSCPEPGPFCPVDAGPVCPSPDTVWAGQPCTTYGSNCNGDPQTCGGQTLYDVLVCQAGIWTTIATTSCSADAGPPDDTGPPDSGAPDGGADI